MPYAVLDSSEYESTTVIYVTIMCIDDHFLKCRVESDKITGFFSGIVSNEYLIGMLYVIYWVIRSELLFIYICTMFAHRSVTI